MEEPVELVMVVGSGVLSVAALVLALAPVLALALVVVAVVALADALAGAALSVGAVSACCCATAVGTVVIFLGVGILMPVLAPVILGLTMGRTLGEVGLGSFAWAAAAALLARAVAWAAAAIPLALVFSALATPEGGLVAGVEMSVEDCGPVALTEAGAEADVSFTALLVAPAALALASTDVLVLDVAEADADTVVGAGAELPDEATESPAAPLVALIADTLDAAVLLLLSLVLLPTLPAETDTDPDPDPDAPALAALLAFLIMEVTQLAPFLTGAGPAPASDDEMVEVLGAPALAAGASDAGLVVVPLAAAGTASVAAASSRRRRMSGSALRLRPLRLPVLRPGVRGMRSERGSPRSPTAST